MSFQKDSNDSILFIWCGEGVFFFSFYKLTSYPFFFTISSPVPIGRSSFFIYSISSVHTHLFMFFPFFFVFVFVLYFMSLSTCVVSDVYRSLCTCESANYMSCPCLLFFFSLFRLFSFYGCC